MFRLGRDPPLLDPSGIDSQATDAVAFGPLQVGAHQGVCCNLRVLSRHPEAYEHPLAKLLELGRVVARNLQGRTLQPDTQSDGCPCSTLITSLTTKTEVFTCASSVRPATCGVNTTRS